MSVTRKNMVVVAKNQGVGGSGKGRVRAAAWPCNYAGLRVALPLLFSGIVEDVDLVCEAD